MRGQWIAAAVLALAGINGVQAQDYPARAVTVIVPFAAGGPADVTGRIVADIFSRYLGQQFVVENVGGAGGTLGSLRAARAAPDGSPSIRSHGDARRSAHVLSEPGYDPEKDFEPIGLIAEQPELLAVCGLPPTTSRSLYLRQSHESKLNMGHAGSVVPYRLPPPQFGDWHQADHGAVHRHSTCHERNRRPGRL
jgi:tripartite-type tricarboxylate transporter receptor subunit TctC